MESRTLNISDIADCPPSEKSLDEALCGAAACGAAFSGAQWKTLLLEARVASSGYQNEHPRRVLLLLSSRSEASEFSVRHYSNGLSGKPE